MFSKFTFSNGATCNRYDPVTCGVCFDEFPASAINHVGCHHSFCEVCWKGYLENAVS